MVHNFVFFFKFYFRNQKKIQRVESRIRCARRRPPIERQPVLSFFFFKGVHRPPLYSLSTLCRRILRLRPTDRWWPTVFLFYFCVFGFGIGIVKCDQRVEFFFFLLEIVVFFMRFSFLLLFTAEFYGNFIFFSILFRWFDGFWCTYHCQFKMNLIWKIKTKSVSFYDIIRFRSSFHFE